MHDNDERELYQVVIVKYGTRNAVRSDVFLNYSVYGTDDGPIDMDYFIWVVRNERRTILVDTGFSAASGAARGRATLMTPPEAWRHLGVDVDSGLTAVLTHGHYDHTGNLEALPAARIVLSETELDFWLGDTASRQQFRHSAETADIAVLAAANADGRVTTFRDRLSIAPGVDVIEVGGHTPGQSVVLVQTSDGPVLLASDAVHYYEELEADMPFTYVADLVKMYETFDRITAMNDSGEFKHLVAGHDPSTLDRFSPLDGPLVGLAATIGRREP